MISLSFSIWYKFLKVSCKTIVIIISSKAKDFPVQCIYWPILGIDKINAYGIFNSLCAK